jgi:hypothetical protein
VALIKHILARYGTGQEMYLVYDDATLVIQTFGGTATLAEGWVQATRPVLATRRAVEIPVRGNKEEDISGWLVKMERDEETGQLVVPLATSTRGGR